MRQGIRFLSLFFFFLLNIGNAWPMMAQHWQTVLGQCWIHDGPAQFASAEPSLAEHCQYLVKKKREREKTNSLSHQYYFKRNEKIAL